MVAISERVESGGALMKDIKRSPLPSHAEVIPFVRRAQQGDDESFGRIFQIYGGVLHDRALYWTKDQEEADDVTSTVFLKVYEHIGTFTEREKGTFTAWVFKILTNELIDRSRRPKMLPLDLDRFTIPEYNLSEQIVDPFDLARLKEARRRLSPTQNEVLAMRFDRDLSVRQTAIALGKTENNVKVLQHKAIARLQKVLGVLG